MNSDELSHPRATGDADLINMRVMVIDDDEPLLKLMQVLLESQGYQVVTYRQPEAAFAALDRFAPALIILNWIFWGEERGLSLLYRLWGRATIVSTPVIVVSGAVYQLTDIEAALRPCGVTVLYKPFTLHAFFTTLHATAGTSPSRP